MNTIIRYFVNYPRLNYVLLAFIFFMGISAYIMMPKEVFPNISSNTISISGSYAGASPNSLDSFAVTEIENQIKTIAGIDEIDSIIFPNMFTILAVLEDGVDPKDKLDEIKDAVAMAGKSFPTDMDAPIVSELKRNNPLLNVILSSDTLDYGELLQKSHEVQTLLLSEKDVSDVIIYGDSDLQVDIFIDEQKAMALGVSSSLIAQKITELSYIYPLGTIDQLGNHLYLSSQNNKTDPNIWNDTLLTIEGKRFYLQDVAHIEVSYPLTQTISRYNQQSSIDLNVLQGDTGNAMVIAKGIKEKIKRFTQENPNVHLGISSDRSKNIEDRLDTVISNIVLGLILVGVLIYFLISPRLSFVIIMGVPFSFVITFIFLYYAGYSINMITLLALLITIGIIVDDAIIVSENIQRHFDEGWEIKEAVVKGALEVVGPVLVASATTVFAFMPLLMLSGRMGAIMLMIPIVVTIAIIASLIESFLFLPLHAKHMLKPKEKMFNWEPIYNAHSKMLHFFVHYKRTFLALFVLIVPLLTVMSMKLIEFQFFPRLDADDLTLSMQLDSSMALEQTNEVAKAFEQRIVEHKKELFAKAVSTTVGYYRSIDGSAENRENALTIKVELEEYDEDNFIQNYLNPIFMLDFDFEQAQKTRKLKSDLVQKKLRALLTPLIKQYEVVDFNVIGRRIGVVKTDIAIDLNGKETQALMVALETIKAKLASIEGVVDITDNAKLGKEEYTFSVNAYGQSLGLTDKTLATTLANFYMERTQANTLNVEGVVEIKTQLLTKNDLASLKALRIHIGTTYVALTDVADISIKRDFAKIEKHDGITAKSVFANVEPKIITASQVLKELEPLLKSLNSSDVSVIIGGEKEQNQQMASELGKAFLVALFLIFIVLLINFNSFKVVLMIISVIPFTILGALLGHFIMGMNLTFPSIIGILGLAGVVINDGIVMLDFLKNVKNLEEFYERVKLRVRPILITSLTTLLGLSTLIFYPSGQGVFLQPLAISLGFGLLWGTILNLFYLPALYALLHKLKREHS